MKPVLAAAIAVALAVPFAIRAQSPATPSVVRSAPAWVATSNGYAQVLMEAEAAFAPESAALSGLTQYDGMAADLGTDVAQRRRDALAQARAALQRALATERDANVRQDLQIMIDVAALRIEGSALSSRYRRDWTDATQLVFRGQQALLQKQVSATRHPKAL